MLFQIIQCFFFSYCSLLAWWTWCTEHSLYFQVWLFFSHGFPQDSKVSSFLSKFYFFFQRKIFIVNLRIVSNQFEVSVNIIIHLLVMIVTSVNAILRTEMFVTLEAEYISKRLQRYRIHRFFLKREIIFSHFLMDKKSVWFWHKPLIIFIIWNGQCVVLCFGLLLFMFWFLSSIFGLRNVEIWFSYICNTIETLSWGRYFVKIHITSLKRPTVTNVYHHRCIKIVIFFIISHKFRRISYNLDKILNVEIIW